MSYTLAYEAREAARWSGATWAAFCKLDGDDQSAVIAHYRVANMIEAVLADDAQRRARQKQKK